MWETLALRGGNKMRGYGFDPCGSGWGSVAPCCDCCNGRPESSDESNDCQASLKELIRRHNYNMLYLFDSF
jgi:hypothetical protein